MTSIIDLQVTTGKCQMMHILLDDDLGRLTVRRLWPWHRLLARCLAPSLDRQLADGVRPEANAVLAARAMVLTSVRYRRGLAGSLRRLLAASVSPQPRPRLMVASRSAGTAAPPGSGRHLCTCTSPGSTSSRPAKNLATSSRVRRVCGVATRSL